MLEIRHFNNNFWSIKLCMEEVTNSNARARNEFLKTIGQRNLHVTALKT